MSKQSRVLLVLTASLTLTATFGRAQSLPRTPGGSDRPNANGGAVQVPRHPYAGAWEGTLTLNTAGTDQAAAVTMTFTVADGARQSYAGETSVAGQRASKHLNVSAAPDSLPTGSSGSVARRSPQTDTGASGPSAASTAERDTLADAAHALLLFHRPSQSMQLCDEGHRCVTLASLTWEERDSAGLTYAYTAKLADADTLAGTVTVTNGSAPPVTGTFALKRRK